LQRRLPRHLFINKTTTTCSWFIITWNLSSETSRILCFFNWLYLSLLNKILVLNRVFHVITLFWNIFLWHWYIRVSFLFEWRLFILVNAHYLLLNLVFGQRNVGLSSIPSFFASFYALAWFEFFTDVFLFDGRYFERGLLKNCILLSIRLIFLLINFDDLIGCIF